MAKKQMRQTKQNKTQCANVPGEWLYVAPEGVDARRIADAITMQEIELWEEAGVIEIAVNEKQSVDIEHVRIHPKDELTRAFVESRGCKEVFLVTFPLEIYEQTQSLMRQILAECGGLFCGDTEDFSPVIS